MQANALILLLAAHCSTVGPIDSFTPVSQAPDATNAAPISGRVCMVPPRVINAGWLEDNDADIVNGKRMGAINQDSGPDDVVGWQALRRDDLNSDELPWSDTFREPVMYTSYIYKVRYHSTEEDSLPVAGGSGPDISAPSDHSKVDDEQVFATYMRISVPCWETEEQHDRLDVMLYVQGGSGEKEDIKAGVVEFEEAAQDANELVSYAASGMSWYGGPNMGYRFREGDPMVTVLFNLPGRGIQREDGRSFEADGAPAFVWDTPGNDTGQDYAGSQTVDAMDAVMDVTLEILDALREDWSGQDELGPDGNRLVVATSSCGLNPGSRWVAETAHDVHALEDWEGPTDALEIIKLTDLINPFNIPAGGREGDPESDDLPEELDFATWERWAQGTPLDAKFTFFFRPTMDVVDELPLDQSSILALLEDDPNVGEYWSHMYAPGRYDSDRYAEEQAEFWRHREAKHNLPRLWAQDTAYVRIQSNSDHAQPAWLLQRHAIKALNAAYDEGANEHVYFTDGVYVDTMADSAAEPLPPYRVQASYDVADPDGVNPWREIWGELDRGEVWGTQLDMVRWALEQDFAS